MNKGASEAAAGTIDVKPDFTGAGFRQYDVRQQSQDNAVIDALTPRADELVIDKNTSSAFNSTGIEWLLRNKHIETIVRQMLRRVQAGDTIIVTLRGRPVAQFGPPAPGALAALEDERHRERLRQACHVIPFADFEQTGVRMDAGGPAPAIAPRRHTPVRGSGRRARRSDRSTQRRG